MSVGKSPLFIIYLILILFFVEVESTHAENSPDKLVKKLVAKFDSIQNYSAIITTSAGQDKNTMQYFFQKPGYAKMVFMQPHNGVSMTYDPLMETVLLQPFKSMRSVSLTLSPDNSLITSPQGHTIDKSDIGHLLDAIVELSENGEVKVLSTLNDNSLNKINLEIKGLNGFTINKINRYSIKFDTECYFPTEVTAYSFDGTIMENVKLAELKIDTIFPTGIFDF